MAPAAWQGAPLRPDGQPFGEACARPPGGHARSNEPTMWPTGNVGLSRTRQFRRIATPSMITFLPLEWTLILRVPERAEVNVVTVMSFLLTVVAE